MSGRFLRLNGLRFALAVSIVVNVSYSSAIAQNDSAEVKIHHKKLRGVEVPEAFAFYLLLWMAASAHDHGRGDAKASFVVLSARQQMRYDTDRAVGLVEQLAELHEVAQEEAETAAKQSACIPEATEWWPDNQAPQALDRIEEVLRRFTDSITKSHSPQ